MSKFIEHMKKRRSIYQIGTDVELSEAEITELIQAAMKEAPSAYNSQSSRAIILFGEAKDRFWQIVQDTLRQVVDDEEAWGNTVSRMKGFSAGVGTVLFYEDKQVIDDLQEQFALYADNFPVWSEHSTGIAQFSVWTALAQVGIGGSLQHYNPLIDEQVAKEFNVPKTWVLRAQMPFGSIIAGAGEKTYMSDADRFVVINE